MFITGWRVLFGVSDLLVIINNVVIFSLVAKCLVCSFPPQRNGNNGIWNYVIQWNCEIQWNYGIHYNIIGLHPGSGARTV